MTDDQQPGVFMGTGIYTMDAAEYHADPAPEPQWLVDLRPQMKGDGDIIGWFINADDGEPNWWSLRFNGKWQHFAIIQYFPDIPQTDGIPTAEAAAQIIKRARKE